MLDGGLGFALGNALEAVGRRRAAADALPRQTAAQEVDEHVRQRLEVVASTLLCRNRHANGGASTNPAHSQFPRDFQQISRIRS